LKVPPPLHLVREFEVMKDSKDSLCDFHQKRTTFLDDATRVSFCNSLLRRRARGKSCIACDTLVVSPPLPNPSPPAWSAG
jgi:hypothetical protein